VTRWDWFGVIGAIVLFGLFLWFLKWAGLI
jgi:hypothetical protein